MEPIDLEPFFPDRDSDEPIGRQIVRRLRSAIETGVFAPSSRLLPSRELAVRLGVGRNTITSAIDQLIAEGYLEARLGSGTYVASDIAIQPITQRSLPYPLPHTAERFLKAAPTIAAFADRSGALRVGSPDAGEFPSAVWRRLARRGFDRMAEHLDYGSATGHFSLRNAIVQHVRQFRGVSAEPHQVIVVEGTQAAIRLSTDVLMSPGDPVLIEDPCYSLAKVIFDTQRMRLSPVDVDDFGMRVEEAGNAQLAYVAPSHNFPLGGTMSLPRRSALLNWARERNAYILEDDYDSEYSFGSRPLPALQSLDRWERVIYIGSFSKTLAPGLRLGYVIVPRHLVEAFSLARVASTLGGATLLQTTLAEFMAEGHFARHIRRMTGIYNERRTALIDTLNSGLGGSKFRIGPSQTGLHLALIGPPGYDDLPVAQACEAEGIRALSTYCIARTDCKGFRIGYSAAPVDEVTDAAQRLLAAIATPC
ncbi:MAG: PLP-dependent aminotransferase family protein [Candidatus Baltobacteraceae bacterium]